MMSMQQSLKKISTGHVQDSYMNEEEPPPYSPPNTLQFSDPGPPTTHTLNNEQCVAHLKLLSAFANLRMSVSDTDGLFGLHNSQAEEFLSEESKSLALSRIREKRWAIYTSRAVDRYTTWWLKNPFPSDQPISTTDLRTPRYSEVTEGLKNFQWQPQHLPPLDVLMVWHSHVLNPHTYLEDCLRAGKIRFWSTDFPWHVIDSAIGWDRIQYSPEEEARVFFQKQTGRLWDNQDESLDKDFDCLHCSKSFTVPWTSGGIGPKLHEAFAAGIGYADNSFNAPCPSCNYNHNVETIRVGSFRRDVQALVNENRPLPGSLLNTNGLPDGSIEYSFPNRVLSTAKVTVLKVTTATPKADLLKRSALDKKIVAGEIGSVQDMLGVRSLIEFTISSLSVMAKANGGNGTRLSVEQKTSMRKMMAHYWENSSIFGLDLVGAVMRQGTFVQKMHDIDWIHSPTISATIAKLIRKYTVFFDIMVKHKKTTVPTLDVDLAWHTHQLSPSRYFKYSRAQSRKYGIEIFINHDDKVDEGKLSEAFQWTCKVYASATNGEVYSECICWYCEAVREATTNSKFPFIKSSSSSRNARSVAERLRGNSKIPSSTEETPHISAHTAVSVQDASGKSRTMAKTCEMQLRAAWEKVHRRAHKSGNAASNEHSDAYTRQLKVWGQPYALSFYAPYMCDPGINKCLYASNPSCRSAGLASYGNCAAGLCGGSGDAAGCAALVGFQ